ncbi:hypothetical protein BC829DRAFT_242419 [Chytridium lagenaria]|nr:hypothetical protein BC829DRAFT_242419 [Chytridium lagenaria]
MGSLEDLRAFLKIVMMKSPRSVDIQGRTLDDEEFKALFTFWVACKDMPSIALTECTIEDERDFGSFYSLVSSISGIEEIIFSGGDMYMDTFTTFVAEKLINAVKTSEKISSIRLSSLSFEEEAFEKLMKGLKDTAVSKLDLSGNILDSPAELIGEFLRNNTTLKDFTYSDNYLDDEQLLLIIDGLKNNTTIRSLKLHGANPDNVTCDGLISLFTTLKTTKLENFEMSFVDGTATFNQECSAAFADFISRTTSLKTLVYIDNGFTDEGAYEFALALQKSKTIQSVEIEGVLSSSKTVHALIEAFKINNNLLLKFDNEEVLNDLVKYEYTLPILFHKNNAANIIQPSSTAASTVIKFNENISDTTATAQQKETNISTTIIETKSRILKASAQLSEKEKDIDYFKKILSAVQSIGAIFKRMSVTHNYLNFDPTWPIELKNEEPSIVLMDRIMDQDRVISDMDKAIIREIGLRLRAKKVNKTMVEWLSQSDDHEDKADEEDAAEVILDDIMDQLNEVDAEVADEAENGHEESKNEEVGDGEGHQESGEGGVSGEVEGGEDAENGDDDNENGDDDYYENDDEEEEEEDVEDDAYSFVYDESLDPENKMVTFTVRKSQYPTVKFVNLRKAAVENDSKTFPTLVIVFLSESIISGLSESEEKVWAAINAWDYMMRLADETFLVVLPSEYF